MVPGPVPFADRVRLGEDVELDLRAYELRKAGRALRLERIPMDLLVLLVEHRGELVTRDQIVERIWGKDVFLDTDGSVNSAVRKIRQALKDDPEQPRFVQTVSGRGYRFIAPIAQITRSDGLTAGEIAERESAEKPAVAPTSTSTKATPRKRGWIVAAVAIAIAFLAARFDCGCRLLDSLPGKQTHSGRRDRGRRFCQYDGRYHIRRYSEGSTHRLTAPVAVP